MRKENCWEDLPPPVDQNLPIPPGFKGGGTAYMSRPILDNNGPTTNYSIGKYTGGVKDDRLDNMKIYGKLMWQRHEAVNMAAARVVCNQSTHERELNHICFSYCCLS